MRKLNPKSYDYIHTLVPAENNLMMESRSHAEQIGLNAISVSATEGHLIKYFLQSIQAEKVVEIGTLTGLSAHYILNSIPGNGYLWTLEKSPEHAAKAEVTLAKEIKNKRCEILIGDAREKLLELSMKAPFDAVFIDGNKAAYWDYFQWAFSHIKVDGLILVDNTFLSGAVWGEATEQKFNNKQIDAVKKMNEFAFNSQSLSTCMIPTLEGLLVCRKIKE